jgi:hypothetical protein
MKPTGRDEAYWKHLDSFESQFRSRLRDMAHGAASDSRRRMAFAENGRCSSVRCF